MSAYPTPLSLTVPIVPYDVTGYQFGQRLRRHLILWMTHLGEDIVAAPDTAVGCSGDGQVVYAGARPGSVTARNWGGLIIVGHMHRSTGQPFYTVYGHVYRVAVRVNDSVKTGQVIAHVAPGATPDNGWWQTPHLHFAIYTGPWTGAVLPGYWRLTRPWHTRRRWWLPPQKFIADYNQQV